MIEEQEVIAVEDPSIPEENLMWDDGAETNDVSEPATELEPTEQVQTPENTEGNTDEQRYQYWQSRYDQKASEFDEMSKKLNVGILIFDKVEVLDFSGPYEVFSVCSELENHKLSSYSFCLLSHSQKSNS